MLETLALMGSGFANALSPVNLFAMAVSYTHLTLPTNSRV